MSPAAHPLHSPFLASLMVATALVATGCSSYAIQEPARAPMTPFATDARTADLAKVCVIKTTNLAFAITFVAWDNGTLVGATKGPTHFCYYAEPGEHDLQVDAQGVARTHYTAEAGKSYFVHEKVRFFGSPLAELSWVSAAEAEKLFPSSSYAVLAEVPKDEALPHGIPVARAKGLSSVR